MSDAKSQRLLLQREREIRGIMRKAATFEPAKLGASSRSGIIEWALFWTFVAGLAWVPYWYGSNLPVTWGINAILFPGLVVLYELSLVVRTASHPVAIRTIRLPAVLFVAVVVWILIQNTIWTPSFLHHPIWSMVADALPRSVEGSITVDRDLTTLALLRLLTAASVLWLGIQLCRNESRAIQFMTALVAISCAYAAYGLIEFASMQSVNTSSPSFVTSTFYNHNHYATYVGMGLVTAFGLIARIYQRDVVTHGGSLRFRIATFIDVTGQKASALLAGAFLLLVAVMLTQSRGGIIATGCGVIVWATLTFARSSSASVERRMIALLLVTVVAGAFVSFGDAFIGKIAKVGLADSNRIGVYALALRSILDQPLLGYGYGTFADIFPMFRDRSISVQGMWEQAHNTYLELFQGLGLIFGVMLLASVILLALKCYKGAIMRQQTTVPAIAIGVAFLVGVHAVVDFSLQLQAVTLTFMAILGAGVAQSESSQLALAD
jgi:O-antigen ligase